MDELDAHSLYPEQLFEVPSLSGDFKQLQRRFEEPPIGLPLGTWDPDCAIHAGGHPNSASGRYSGATCRRKQHRDQGRQLRMSMPR